MPNKSKIPIPPDTESLLLPPQDLSVWDFASFELPRPSRTVAKAGGANNIPDYFVTGTPKSVDTDYIRVLFAPPDAIVDRLHEYATTSPAAAGSTAIRCLHLPGANDIGLMPPWIVEIWKRAKDLRSEKSKWARAKELLVERARITRANGTLPSIVERVSGALQSIVWSGDIKGFSNAEPIVSLSLYATNEWFTDVQETHMLDLLRMDVLEAGRALMDEVAEIWMMEFIRTAWRERERYEKSGTSKQYPRAKALGAVLASGDRERLGMMGNLQNLHWIAVVVDCKESRILYGDPFKSARDPETEKALEWWTHYHTGRRFSWGILDVPMQKDGFNLSIATGKGPRMRDSK